MSFVYRSALAASLAFMALPSMANAGDAIRQLSILS